MIDYTTQKKIVKFDTYPCLLNQYDPNKDFVFFDTIFSSIGNRVNKKGVRERDRR